MIRGLAASFIESISLCFSASFLQETMLIVTLNMRLLYVHRTLFSYY